MCRKPTCASILRVRPTPMPRGTREHLLVLQWVIIGSHYSKKVIVSITLEIFWVLVLYKSYSLIYQVLLLCVLDAKVLVDKLHLVGNWFCAPLILSAPPPSYQPCYEGSYKLGRLLLTCLFPKCPAQTKLDIVGSYEKAGEPCQYTPGISRETMPASKFHEGLYYHVIS